MITIPIFGTGPTINCATGNTVSSSSLNVMSAPFSGRGCVRTPLCADWGIRLVRVLHDANRRFFWPFEPLNSSQQCCEVT